MSLEKKTPRVASRTCFVQFGEVIPMSVQLEHFSGVVDRMVKLSGQRKTAALLRKSIFFISTGSNDMFEYSASSRADDDDDEAFLGALVDAYKHYIMVRTKYCSLQAALVINRQILLRPARINSASALSQTCTQSLYEMGARKFSVISIPPLGCIPSQRLRRLKQLGTQGCFDPLNDLSLSSYPMLAGMLQQLSDQLPGMAYSLADAYAMVSFVFQNPRTEAWSKPSLLQFVLPSPTRMRAG